jgi:hypothetical protein
VQESSEPAATVEIVDAAISPTNVTVGDLLAVSATVRNTWDRPLSTVGPMPGFVYEQQLSYLTVPFPGRNCTPCDVAGRDTIGAWRVAVGSTTPGSEREAGYPFRWGLGGELAPGATTTVTVRIKIARFFEPTHFWVALIQEPNHVMREGVATTVITSLPAR